MKASELRAISIKKTFDKQVIYDRMKSIAESSGDKFVIFYPFESMHFPEDFILELINNGFGVKSFVDNNMGGLEGKIISW